jgi:hypothetical protein
MNFIGAKMFSGITSYLAIGAGIIIVLLIGSLTFVNMQLNTSKAQLETAIVRLNVIEDVVKEQNNLIDDMIHQNGIIIQNFRILQDRTNEIERLAIERSRETDDIVSRFDFEGAKELSERMSGNFNKLFRELENAARRLSNENR